jgi:signal transduction histidine kinase
VNLVKNAAEAMPGGGNIKIGLGERAAEGDSPAWLVMTIEDTGPGIPEEALEAVFASGYTTRAQAKAGNGGWLASHRGLGLAITRCIVEAAGGRIFAANRGQGGALFVMELPVRTAGFSLPAAGLQLPAFGWFAPD